MNMTAFNVEKIAVMDFLTDEKQDHKRKSKQVHEA
jgi:hypothetical protein